MRQMRLSVANVRGFTLIELMVAMLLGLVVIAGVGSVFLSNQRVYRTNRALSDVQDSSRVAFELLARDVRNAGLTACSNSGRISNVLNAGPNAGGTAWWADWVTPSAAMRATMPMWQQARAQGIASPVRRRFS